MKQSKKSSHRSAALRRERAKARFSALSFNDWKNQDKVYVGSHADYSAYLDRKSEEGVSLGLRVVPVLENGNYVDAHVFARKEG